MSDWRRLVSDQPWAFGARSEVHEGETRTGVFLDEGVATELPQLSELLSRSRVTDLTIDGVPFRLLVWREPRLLGWLSPIPQAIPDAAPFPLHKELLRSFGGIVERFNEPEDTWLLNMNEVLTADQVRQDASFVDDYSWAFEEAGLTIPIDLSAYYPIAWEANGNCTLVGRSSGDLIVFAPDYSDDHLVPLEGCPEFSLHRHRTAASFRDWVDNVAGQWLRAAA